MTSTRRIGRSLLRSVGQDPPGQRTQSIATASRANGQLCERCAQKFGEPPTQEKPVAHEQYGSGGVVMTQWSPEMPSGHAAR